jgi:hypothetical protein
MERSFSLGRDVALALLIAGIERAKDHIPT